MTETAELPQIVELTCRRDARPQVARTMSGEVNGTPGLALVPAHRRVLGGGWEFTGAWDVRHRGSGKTLFPPFCGLALGHAREALHLLGDLPVDWTQTVEGMQDQLHDCFDLFREAGRRIRIAVDEQRPIYRDPSWQQTSARWLLIAPDDADALDTREAAEQQLEEIRQNLGELGEGWQVRREDSDPWQLLCAATGCREVLIDEDVVEDVDPGRVAEIAGYVRWRRIDARHWLCPRCSYLFTAL